MLPVSSNSLELDFSPQAARFAGFFYGRSASAFRLLVGVFIIVFAVELTIRPAAKMLPDLRAA
jgi:hypothetical protein